MQEKTLDYNGSQLHYYIIGKGSPVVLLHGFGEDATVWRNQYNAWPGYKLILPHLPGSGHSDVIQAMSIEGMADAIKFLVDTECPKEKFTIIGHSMGGYIVLALVEMHPERINGFGLFHSTAFADSGQKKEKRNEGIKKIMNDGAALFLRNLIPTLFAVETKSNNYGLIEEQLAHTGNFLSSTLVSYYMAMRDRKDRSVVLRKAQVPVLIIMGRKDTVIAMDESLQQCLLPQIAYIHVLEQSGHMGMIEEVATSNKIVKDFITSIVNPVFT